MSDQKTYITKLKLNGKEHWIKDADGYEQTKQLKDDLVAHQENENNPHNVTLDQIVENFDGNKIPSSYLPSYVDDIVEGYYEENIFYTDKEKTDKISAEAGKIYVDIDTNKTYRWSGSQFVEIHSVEDLANELLNSKDAINVSTTTIDIINSDTISINQITLEDKENEIPTSKIVKDYVDKAIQDNVNEEKVNELIAQYLEENESPTDSMGIRDSNKSGNVSDEELPTSAAVNKMIDEKGYATETYVVNKIEEAQLSGGEVDLSGYATQTYVDNKLSEIKVPTKVSELTNDSGYITNSALNGYATQNYVSQEIQKAIQDSITTVLNEEV